MQLRTEISTRKILGKSLGIPMIWGKSFFETLLSKAGVMKLSWHRPKKGNDMVYIHMDYSYAHLLLVEISNHLIPAWITTNHEPLFEVESRGNFIQLPSASNDGGKENATNIYIYTDTYLCRMEFYDGLWLLVCLIFCHFGVGILKPWPFQGQASTPVIFSSNISTFGLAKVDVFGDPTGSEWMRPNNVPTTPFTGEASF